MSMRVTKAAAKPAAKVVRSGGEASTASKPGVSGPSAATVAKAGPSTTPATAAAGRGAGILDPKAPDRLARADARLGRVRDVLAGLPTAAGRAGTGHEIPEPGAETGEPIDLGTVLLGSAPGGGDAGKLRGLLQAGGLSAAEIGRLLGREPGQPSAGGASGKDRAGAGASGLPDPDGTGLPGSERAGPPDSGGIELPGSKGPDLRTDHRTDPRTEWSHESTQIDRSDNQGNQSIQSKEVYHQDDGTTLEVRESHVNGTDRISVTLKDADGKVIDHEESTRTSRPADTGMEPGPITEDAVRRFEAKRKGAVDPTGPDGGVAHDVERLARTVLVASQSKVNPAPDDGTRGGGEAGGPPDAEGLVHRLAPSTPLPTTGKGPKPDVGPGGPVPGKLGAGGVPG